ncbi:MAG: hypothetical protein ABIG95_01600 [Candidatus Woesearchaeota archaeon]
MKKKNEKERLLELYIREIEIAGGARSWKAFKDILRSHWANLKRSSTQIQRMAKTLSITAKIEISQARQLVFDLRSELKHSKSDLDELDRKSKSYPYIRTNPNVHQEVLNEYAEAEQRLAEAEASLAQGKTIPKTKYDQMGRILLKLSQNLGKIADEMVHQEKQIENVTLEETKDMSNYLKASSEQLRAIGGLLQLMESEVKLLMQSEIPWEDEQILRTLYNRLARITQSLRLQDAV